MSENLLEIKDLHVVYKTMESDIYALNGINLTLHKGETLGLVGETGAGKTTTALSIMKLLPDRVGQITNGQILYDNTDIVKASAAAMRSLRGNEISMIFQDPMTSLNPIHTVGKQIAEVIDLHNAKFTHQEIEAKVDEIMELVGIPSQRKDEYPHQFSGGMKQRIIIAIALACNPKLLLADEPTTALDVTIQAQVLKLMNELKKKLNTAMLLITHDLGIVAQTCDSIAIMYAGEIIETGTVEDIFRNEKHHPYTVGLFGSIPDMSKKTRRLSPIEGLMPDPSMLPVGCRFVDRCKQRMDICSTHAPAQNKHGTHSIKCHLFSPHAAMQETNS